MTRGIKVSVFCGRKLLSAMLMGAINIKSISNQAFVMISAISIFKKGKTIKMDFNEP